MIGFAEYTITEFTDTIHSVAEKEFDISRGMIGFDREIDASMCMAEADVLPKKCPNLSANKTARGVLSPIQVGNLGFVPQLA